MASLRVVSGLMAAGLVVTAAAQQQQPTFRAGVDLVTFDVVVLDKSGAPVPTLTAEDFTVTAGKKPRRIVGAEFVRSTPPARAADLKSVSMPSSNRRLLAARTVIFLIDVEQIPSGGGRSVMRGIGAYLDRLGAEDRVGVVTLADMRVSPTTNRAAVREAVGRLVGTSIRHRDKEMTWGEAPGIAARDSSSLMAYWRRISDQGPALPGDRTCSPPPNFETRVAVSPDCIRQAEAALERVRTETRRVLTRLGQVAQAMDTVPDPKAILLVSGGLFTDGGTRSDLVDFASAAERAHVSVSALFVESDSGSGGGGSNTDTKRLESQIGFGGLLDLTTLARGSAQRVINDPSPALARVDHELSGYYNVFFERDPDDRLGERIPLDVRVRRPDLTVLSRQGVTPTRPFSAGAGQPSADLKAGVAALLKSSTPVTQVPVTVDTVALPSSASGQDARLVLAVQFGTNADAVAAFGFQCANESGKVIADGYEAPPPVHQLSGGRSGFVTTFPASSGRHIVRVGVIDSRGQRGSLQRTFEIAAFPEEPVRLSDLMFGSVLQDEFTPGVGTATEAGVLGLRLVVRDASGNFDGMRVRMSVAEAVNGGPIDTVDALLLQTPDQYRRFADAGVNINFYPPGEYVVTATVTKGTAEVGKRQRIFVR